MVRDGAVVGAARGWIDGLEAGDAEVLLGYRHELFGRWAAVTRRPLGTGSITVVGTLLDRSTLADVIAGTADVPATLLAARPSSVTAHSLTAARGRVWVVHNWSPQPRTVVLARAAASVIDDARHEADAEVTLAPWDVRVWRET